MSSRYVTSQNSSTDNAFQFVSPHLGSGSKNQDNGGYALERERGTNTEIDKINHI